MAEVEYLNYDVLESNGWTLDDDELFEKATNAELPEEDHGTFTVSDGESILDAAESEGFDWPFLCRSGTCANCSVFLYEGGIEMGRQLILSDEEIEQMNVRLSCIGEPATEAVKLVFNAKQHEHMQKLT